jgi:hypothetical protein
MALSVSFLINIPLLLPLYSFSRCLSDVCDMRYNECWVSFPCTMPLS